MIGPCYFVVSLFLSDACVYFLLCDEIVFEGEMSSDILRDPGVHFTEIQVKQMDKPTISLPFYGC